MPQRKTPPTSARKPLKEPAQKPVGAMHLFALNLIMMLAWVVLTVGFTPENFFVGYIVAWLALFFTRSLYGNPTYFKKPYLLVKYTAIFVYRLFASSFWVVLDILTVKHKARPGIVAVPLDVKTEAQLLLLTNYISLTPGTLSLDVDTDKNILYVHAMFIDDPARVRDDIKNGIEKEILELTA